MCFLFRTDTSAVWFWFAPPGRELSIPRPLVLLNSWYASLSTVYHICNTGVSIDMSPLCVLGKTPSKGQFGHFTKVQEGKKAEYLAKILTSFKFLWSLPLALLYLRRFATILSCGQIDSTRLFVASSMRISSGHRPVYPSSGHLRVASIPIFDPKSCRRAA